jgi:hypothetical protein
MNGLKCTGPFFIHSSYPGDTMLRMVLRNIAYAGAEIQPPGKKDGSNLSNPRFGFLGAAFVEHNINGQAV